MNHSMPGLPVHHQLPESNQTHVHWADDAIQPSHPLLFASPPALNLSQHQGLFQWVSFLHQVRNQVCIRWPKYRNFSFNISLYIFSFVHQVNQSIVFYFAGVFWFCLWVYKYMCIFSHTFYSCDKPLLLHWILTVLWRFPCFPIYFWFFLLFSIFIVLNFNFLNILYFLHLFHCLPFLCSCPLALKL